MDKKLLLKNQILRIQENVSEEALEAFFANILILRFSLGKYSLPLFAILQSVILGFQHCLPKVEIWRRMNDIVAKGVGKFSNNA